MPTLRRAAREASILAGHVARHTDFPRDAVEGYLARHLEDCLAELGAAWLEGWDSADRGGRERVPSRYARRV